ncbi:Ktr system potassium transporter B [Pseudoruegeria sp. SK021]|nr:Ktr system potassium transporter B [Pseudoruegeria sp. SK021]
MALLYGTLVVLGTFLLKLPAAHNGPLNWMEALFTSASAVTVTGLSVVDTGTVFTAFGQAVIMVLIQLGGLGLMTFAVLLLSAMGIPMGMNQRIILREDLNQTSLSRLGTLAQLILKIAIACELLGVAVLAVVFVPEFGWGTGLWHALFHSVSAFNNAGFALFPDGLSRWVGDPIINLAIPLMFILGGLGFVVIGDISAKRRWRTLSLHSKLMLSGTAALILGPWAIFLALEWTNPNTLGAIADVPTRVMAAWFQVVTTRTAGFNTLEIESLHDSTSLMMMLLMVIGGGSTSTAGGIKVTTFILLLVVMVAFFQRRTTLHVFGRSLGLEEAMKVMALTTVSLLTVMVAVFAISISHDGAIFDLGFEVASAFGTVGLSRGTTTELDTFGRLVIIVVMMIGRVGPLTLGFFLATRSVPRVRYPAGQVHLG